MFKKPKAEFLIDGYCTYGISGRKINQTGSVKYYSDGKLFGSISDKTNFEEISNFFIGNYFRDESSIAFLKIPNLKEYNTDSIHIHSLISERLEDGCRINGSYSGFFGSIKIIGIHKHLESALFEKRRPEELIKKIPFEFLMNIFFNKRSLEVICSNGYRKDLRCKLTFC